MKKILYSLVTALFALSFSACDNNDTEGVYYHAENTEAVFAKASGAYFYAGSDPGEYNVTLIRGNANGAASIPVTATDQSGYFTVPATANFADGSYEATLTVTFNKEALEVGKVYSIALEIPENPIQGKQTTYKLNVTRDYSWEVIAQGTYTSALFGESSVTLERANENKSYYKLKDVFAEGYDYKLLVDDSGAISMMEDLNDYGFYDITTGYVHPSYGMIYSYLDPDPAYSYFDAENQLIVLSQYYYVGAGSFGWFDDYFVW